MIGWLAVAAWCAFCVWFSWFGVKRARAQTEREMKRFESARARIEQNEEGK